MEKTVDLTPLAEIGRGRAYITDTLVEIETSGILGGMKAWLIGGEAVPLGNLVDGKLRREIDTTQHSGIFITQSGRQMLVGKYADYKEEILKEPMPKQIEGISWEKRTQPSFSALCRELRFILSNKYVYENYRKHRTYWVADNGTSVALALPVEDGETPLSFLGDVSRTEGGYSIICVDKETKKLFCP